MSTVFQAEAQGVKNRPGQLIHIAVAFSVFKLFHNDNASLIHCRNKIFCLSAEKALYRFHCVVVFFLLKFHDHNNAAYIRINMEFLGTVVDIHQQKIIKKKIFDKAVLIKTLFICNDQILYLERCQLANHISVLVVTMGNQNIFQLIIVAHLKILKTFYKLTVSLRFYKCLHISRLN